MEQSGWTSIPHCLGAWFRTPVLNCESQQWFYFVSKSLQNGRPELSMVEQQCSLVRFQLVLMQSVLAWCTKIGMCCTYSHNGSEWTGLHQRIHAVLTLFSFGPLLSHPIVHRWVSWILWVLSRTWESGDWRVSRHCGWKTRSKTSLYQYVGQHLS